MATFDGANRIIILDGTLTESIRALYSRWCDWCVESDNLKYLMAFSVVADPPKVPVYATLENGWRIRPLGRTTPYILKFSDGFLYTSDGGDPFIAVASGVEPRIRWENPVIAVGYDMGGTGGGTGGGGSSITAADVWADPTAQQLVDKVKTIHNNTEFIPFN